MGLFSQLVWWRERVWERGGGGGDGEGGSNPILSAVLHWKAASQLFLHIHLELQVTEYYMLDSELPPHGHKISLPCRRTWSRKYIIWPTMCLLNIPFQKQSSFCRSIHSSGKAFHLILDHGDLCSFHQRGMSKVWMGIYIFCTVVYI